MSSGLSLYGENYIVVWSDRRFSKTYWWVTAARISRNGVVLDTGRVVGAARPANEYYPALACDGRRTLAVWYHSYHAPWGIYGRFINAEARAEDSVFRIAQTRTHFHNLPRVAFGDSAYFVAWADHREGYDDFDIRGWLLHRTGGCWAQSRQSRPGRTTKYGRT